MHQDVVLRFDKAPEYKGTLRTFMIPLDQVGFERQYRRSFAEAAGTAEGSLWFIWRAYKREHSAAPDDFEAFLEDLREYELPDHEEDDLLPPTTETPPSG